MKEIEPSWVDITKFTYSHPLIPESFHNMRIIQFSDTHLGFQYNLSDLEKTVEAIQSLNPDIICFTGDLMDNPNEYKITPELYKLLSQLEAPLGKFGIFGNHDHGGYGTEIYKEVMTNSGFTLLVNESNFITQEDGSQIIISGIDDAMLGKPNLDVSIPGQSSDLFTILLSHAPDYADYATNYPIQLQLSGHSHGGQIQIPLLGAIVTPPFAEKYREGAYTIDSLSLYVNRGLGTTRIPYRLFSRPEITVIDLQNGQEGLKKQ
jgi:predicted MPP superfamily phosphohydrolase